MPPLNQFTSLKPFSVVKFTEDNAVEVVSSSWINAERSSCLWPDKIRSYKSLVKSHAQPGSTWTQFPCILMRDYDHYEDARRGSIRAQDESDLNTGPDTSCGHQNTRKRRTNYVPKPVIVQPNENSDADDSSSGEEMPIIPTHRLSLVDHHSSPRSALKEDKTLRANTNTHREDVIFGNQVTPSTSYQVIEPLPSELQYPTPASGHSSGVQSVATFIQPLQPEVDQIPNSTEHIVGSNKVDLIFKEVQIIKEQSARFQNKILKLLIKIDQDNEELLRRTADQTEEPSIDLPGLPLNTTEELESLNLALKSESQLKTLIKRLRSVGGESASSVTHRILSRLVTNSLAKRLSLTGRGKKTDAGLRGTELMKVVYGAVQSSKRCTDTTESEIDKFVQNWLKNSSDRSGGREERRQARCTRTIPSDQDGDTSGRNLTAI